MTPTNLQDIRKTRERGIYSMRQLGTDDLATIYLRSIMRSDSYGWTIFELCEVVKLRTQFLYNVIPCGESASVIKLMEDAMASMPYYRPRGKVIEAEYGHIFRMTDARGNVVSADITFLRRNSSAITHMSEWPGIQTQELLRIMIDWITLDNPNHALADMFRKAIWEYEGRAYRRKRQEFNRQAPQHELTEFPYGHEGIEHMGIGDDGHIEYIESEILYYANFGACDAEPIPGVSPFAMETDPVYKRAAKKLGLTPIEA